MTEVAITSILVPEDFSTHADRAFRYALMLARRHDARLQLVHVVEDPFATGAWAPEVYVPNVTELLHSMISHAEEQLAALAASAAAQGVTADIAVIKGRPALAILDHASSGGFDLIVMGTHGRTGLSHAVLGSVAERIVRKASCPVLTVHANEATA